MYSGILYSHLEKLFAISDVLSNNQFEFESLALNTLWTPCLNLNCCHLTIFECSVTLNKVLKQELCHLYDLGRMLELAVVAKSLELEELNDTRGGWERELSLRLTQWVMADKCTHALELCFIVAPKLSVTTLTWFKGV